MRLVIVTGLSGAGKSTALKMLEDARYFCVDNLPIPLVSKFVSLMAGMQGEKYPAWQSSPEAPTGSLFRASSTM